MPMKRVVFKLFVSFSAFLSRARRECPMTRPVVGRMQVNKSRKGKVVRCRVLRGTKISRRVSQ